LVLDGYRLLLLLPWWDERYEFVELELLWGLLDW
jgi:hypothetical protein